MKYYRKPRKASDEDSEDDEDIQKDPAEEVS